MAERVLRRSVELSEIDMQRVAGWPDFHPEDYCHRCGNRNVYSWHAPDDVWARLREADLLPASEIVCPPCFTILAAQIGVEPSVWHLVPCAGAWADAIPRESLSPEELQRRMVRFETEHIS